MAVWMRRRRGGDLLDMGKKGIWFGNRLKLLVGKLFGLLREFYVMPSTSFHCIGLFWHYWRTKSVIRAWRFSD